MLVELAMNSPNHNADPYHVTTNNNKSVVLKNFQRKDSKTWNTKALTHLSTQAIASQQHIDPLDHTPMSALQNNFVRHTNTTERFKLKLEEPHTFLSFHLQSLMPHYLVI